MKTFTPNGATVLNGDSAEDFMQKKTLNLVECERCHGSFSENLMRNGMSESDLCENCFHGIIARAELATNGD